MLDQGFRDVKKIDFKISDSLIVMFSVEEIEALVLGSRWVSEHADLQLANAAQNALAKIAAVLPADLRRELDTSALLIGPGGSISAGDQELAQIRLAIRSELKIDIHYCDLKNQGTQRRLWPFALGFFEQARVLIAWCELRKEIRHFRTDRITELALTKTPYPRRHEALLQEWRLKENIAAR